MSASGDGKSTGISTGLQVSYEFSNAVLHSLSRHPKATTSEDGTILPINDEVWQQAFRLEFPNRALLRNRKPTQDLSTYCGYYSRGEHGLGYDQQDRFDFGQGVRGGKKRGNPAKPHLLIRPGNHPILEPSEVIECAKNLWENFRRSPQQADTVESHPSLRLAQSLLGSEGYFEHEAEDEARVYRPIAIRRGQPEFRKRLIEVYGGRCAFSRCDAVCALEAAHVIPYSVQRNYRVSNGLLLRADIHTLFDLNLLAVNPERRTIAIARELVGTAYEEFAGQPLLEPENDQHRPDVEALRHKWSRVNGTLSDAPR